MHTAFLFSVLFFFVQDKMEHFSLCSLIFYDCILLVLMSFTEYSHLLLFQTCPDWYIETSQRAPFFMSYLLLHFQT